MRRRIIPTRLLAITLALALFLGNDFTMFPLADAFAGQISNSNIGDSSVTDEGQVDDGYGINALSENSDTSDDDQEVDDREDEDQEDEDQEVEDQEDEDQEVDDQEVDDLNNEDSDNNDPNGNGQGETDFEEEPEICADGEHKWVTEDGVTACSVCGIKCEHEEWDTDLATGVTSCPKCGIEKPEEPECSHEWVTEDGITTCSVCGIECEHEYVTDSETGITTCIKCGTEKPEEECEHEWVTEDGITACSVCHIECEHEWVTEDGITACSVCGIECNHEWATENGVTACSVCGIECEHEWITEDGITTCSVCGIECEHEYVTDSETGITTCIKCGTEKPEEECEHEWVTDPDTLETKCSICGEVCVHDEWVTDSETGITTCAKCGIEKPEEECEHEWIRDPETLEVVCSICDEVYEDYVEEDECPESPWGFHIYEENEDGTGYVCFLCNAEKEELDPLDVTMEMFMNSSLAIATFAVDRAGAFGYTSNPANWDNPWYSDLPKSLEQLENYDSDTLYVGSLGDLIVLQDMSTLTDFEGYTIVVTWRSIGDYDGPLQTQSLWQLKNVVDPKFEFKGLGSATHPFRGTFYTNAGGTNFNTGKPLFNYLATSATIGGEYTMNVHGEISVNDGSPVGILAGTLVKDERDNELGNESVTLKNITLDGSVASTGTNKATVGTNNARGPAGLVFGRVETRAGDLRLPYDSAAIRLAVSTTGTVSGFHAGGFAGETTGTIGGEIKGDIILDISDPDVMGAVTVTSISATWNNPDNYYGELQLDNTAAAGMYVGAMDKGILSISGKTYGVNVQGYGSNGGFVGMAVNTKVSIDASEDNPVTIVKQTSSTSSYAIDGRTSGGILGYFGYTNDQAETPLLTLDHITVSAYIRASSYHAGGVLGLYYRNMDGSTSKNYDTIDNVTLSGTIYASSYHAGGVVGCVNGSNLRIGSKNAESIKAGGTIYGSNNTGGVVGMITGQYVEIQNAYVNATLYSSYPSTSGGIVGSVGKSSNDARKSVIKVSDIKVDNARFGNGSYSSSANRGGVLGYAYPGSMVALDGSIYTQMTITGSYTAYYLGRTGFIAGFQQEALIYFEDTAEYNGGGSSNSLYVDDIGNYGGVYRNGKWGEKENIFSYEEALVKGTVGGSVDSKKWTIDTEADFIRLAVMLNTDGRFASNCFGTSNPNKDTLVSGLKANLLTHEYNVTKSLDLKGSGVFSLNRNDSTGYSSNNQIFTGKFKGSGSKKVTIDLGDITTRQAFVAFIPYVGNGAEISGFTLKRTIGQVVINGAGIACQSTGSFTAKDLFIDLTSAANPSRYGINGFDAGSGQYYYVEGNGSTIRTSRQYYAGLVARVTAQAGTTFTVENVKVNGTIYGNHSYSSYYSYVQIGGMVADYVGTSTSTISVDGFELMSQFAVRTSVGHRISGMITDINNSANNSGTNDYSVATTDTTKISMTNIKIHDGAQIYQSSGNTSYPCGGWLGYIWKNIIPDGDKHYSINSITIGDGTSASEGPYYSVNAQFGGLINTVTGRIQLKGINIQNGIFNNNSTRDGVGLLFMNGINALIEIDGYTIDGRPIGDTTPNNNGKVQFLKPGTNYDEIVAYNIGIYASSSGSVTHEFNYYKTGGIVNIIYPAFSAGAQHHYVYQNRLHASKNLRRTRYYYNLFGTDFANEAYYLGGSGDTKGTMTNGTVEGAEQMMIWHLTQYMNLSINRFLKDYYDNGTVPARSQSNNFNGDLDLDKVSYYPTPVDKGTYTFNGTVTFYGQDIYDRAGDAMTASVDSKEHYMMHAGLFLSRQNATDNDVVTVQGESADKFLTLKGSVTNLSGDTDGNNVVDTKTRNNSGAVFCRDIKGNKNIYRIKFDGLYLVGYTNADPAGLMIGIVRDKSTLDISWIETVNYTGYGAGKKRAASALIGLVGHLEAKEISIEFTNIRLDSRKQEGIFEYASLIDENYYVEDTNVSTNNLRRLRYLFTESAFKGVKNESGPYVFPFAEETAIYGKDQYDKPYVTIGYELGEGIEYWDNEDGPEPGEAYNLPFRTGSFTWSQKEVEDNYVPYVHTDHTSSKNIEVNPKNKSITEGCGTYEDPYIIDDPKQLLALARYLQNKDDYKYLSNWKINKFKVGRERNTTFPSTSENNVCLGTDTHEDEDLKTYTVVQNKDTGKWEVKLDKGFPTQEELSQAYYKIVKDVDLSNMRNSTDRVIAENFVGLGTSEIPFRGVIIGEYDPKKATDRVDNDDRPKLTWPLKPNWVANGGDVNHGLVQYAMGAVVKDLRITAANNTDSNGKRIKDDKTEVALIKKMAGGVMADILGGDNIIDNVSVSIKVAVPNNSCTVGAYVGTVEQGSLILRNLKEDCASDFEVGQWRAGATGAADKNVLYNQSTVAGYIYVSGLIGKVEDGCVIYDDTKAGGTTVYDGSVAVLEHNLPKIDGIYDHSEITVKNDNTTTVTRVSLPISDHYDIIVKSHLDEEVRTGGKIIVTKDPGVTETEIPENGTNDHFTATLKTSAHLQIVSMAVNSDAFSVYYGDGGYKDTAACRKAQYDNVGKVDTSGAAAYYAETDFLNARDTDDETYWYPYLYTFFDFSTMGSGQVDGIKATLQEKEYTKNAVQVTGYISKLNAATTDVAPEGLTKVKNVMNYKLVGKDVNGETVRYNLAQYCRGFRGIGATYGMITTTSRSYYGDYDSVKKENGKEVFYSDFRANFDGDGAIIELGLNRGYDSSIHTTALFNDLLDRDIAKSYLYTIKDFTVEGRVTSVEYTGEKDGRITGVTTNVNGAGGTSYYYAYPNRTAAIAGWMRRPWKLSDITLQNMEVVGKGHTGGLVAWVETGRASGDGTAARDYKFTDCVINGVQTKEGDKGTTIQSYGGSAGGMIAVVTQQDCSDTVKGSININLAGCKIFGTSKEQPVEVKVIKRTSDQFYPQYWGYNDYGTRNGVGRSGGFIGYVGRKDYSYGTIPAVYVVIENSAKNAAKVEWANITGSYSTGGLIGTYDGGLPPSSLAATAVTPVIIKSAEVSDCELLGERGNTGDYYYFNYGVGGLIGEMRANALEIDPSEKEEQEPEPEKQKQEIILQRTNVTSSFTSSSGMYAGGVVGCLKVYKATFKKITMDGGLASDTEGSPELGAQTYSVRSAISDAGGIIGHASYGAGTLTMSGIHVVGMNIAVDTRAAANGKFATASVSGSHGSAGGLIGSNQMTLTLTGDTTKTDAKERRGTGALVENCMIMGGQNSVGGIVGIMERNTQDSTNGNINVRSSNIQDIVVEENIIGLANLYSLINGSATYVGGVYGQLGSNYRYNSSTALGNTQRIENSIINNNWIYGHYAGGVLGYGSSYHKIFSNDTAKDLIVTDNNIYGRFVGGAMGYCNASQIDYVGTKIVGNRLQAYGSTAYVGGFMGRGNQTNTSHRYDLDELDIEENYILVGSNGSYSDIGAGGLFGYTNNHNCYSYRPTLKDNLIGYSDCESGAKLKTASADYTTLEQLFNSTDGEIGIGNATTNEGNQSEKSKRNVYLITGTNTLTAVKMPTLEELKKENSIGKYSARIGNLIGGYCDKSNSNYAKTAHTYIMQPNISYNDDTITTRPVIDVGSAKGTETEDTQHLLGAPYEYRTNIHIIYYEPLDVPDSDAGVWDTLAKDGYIDLDGDGNPDTDSWRTLFDGISYTGLMTDYRNRQNATTISEYLDNIYRLNVNAAGGGLLNVDVAHSTLFKNGSTYSSSLQAGADTALNKGTKLPVVVLDLQNGTPDQMMKNVVAALTGGGGVYNSDEDDAYAYSSSYGMGRITNIEAKPMKINKDGKVFLNKATGAKTSLKIDGKDTGKWTLTYDDFDDDGLTYHVNNDNGSIYATLDREQTFTLLTITYSWNSGAAGTPRSAKISIPVFTVERLNIDTHFKIVEGLEYSAERAKENGMSANVNVANDSSYTLYMEYIYSRARTKYADKAEEIERYVGAYEVQGDMSHKDVGFPKGTKLTLIDVDDNNKVYYYTVTGKEEGLIPFTDFKDEKGNSYKYKDISQDNGFTICEGTEEKDKWKTEDWEWTGENSDNRGDSVTYEYTNVAVERFLLNVDISGVAEADRVKKAARVVDNRLKLSDDMVARTTLTEHTRLEMRILEGITIHFYNKDKPNEEEKTWIEGKISAGEDDGYVDLWATFEIDAEYDYWLAVSREEKSVIDSANQDKYLELQIYMTQKSGTEEIMLPSGTFVSIEGVRTQPKGIVVAEQEDHIDRTSLGSYYDVANIFYYKDGKLLFEMNALSKILSEEFKAASAEGRRRTTVVRWDTYTRLDFRAANMQAYADPDYDIHIKLLRTEDSNYPIGGDVMDTYSKNIQAKRPDALACALEVENLMDLGINTYDRQTKMPHKIDFDFKMDFSGVMTGNTKTDKELADMYYTVAYRILEKQFAEDGESYKYVPYNGDKLELTLVDDPGDQMDEKNVKNLTLVKPKNKKDEMFWWADYKFEWKEIRDGTKKGGDTTSGGTSQGGTIEGSDTSDLEGKNVIIRDVRLTVKDEDYDMDLSNYKVQVIVFANDYGYASGKFKIDKSDLEYESPLSDFFIFTVAKLKTDLDY